MPMSRKGTNVYCPLGKINIEAVPSQGYWSGGGQFLCWRNKGGKKSEGETGGTHFYKRGGLRPFKVRILYHDVSEQCTCDPNIRSENRSFSDESDDNSESDRGPYPEEGVDEMSTFGLETGMY